MIKSPPKKKKSPKRHKIRNILEYVAVSGTLFLASVLPDGALKPLSNIIGDLFYFLVKSRREVALTNLRHAFKNEKCEEEIRAIARGCCRSFILTPLEIIKLQPIYKNPDAIDTLRNTTDNLDRLLIKARQIHDQAKGCIFVTPHLGNWELLPHTCFLYGIPLSVVVRPLDNPYLEKQLYQHRVSMGQIIIPKKNALFFLHQSLKRGRSIGILSDQSTNRGPAVNFFGRKAGTTPVPAMLAVTHNRPVVVVACCRKEDRFKYEGFVSDPIWPREYTSERDEIIRITTAINAEMESIIRKYPEQYLWVHKRWKAYKSRYPQE